MNVHEFAVGIANRLNRGDRFRSELPESSAANDADHIRTRDVADPFEGADASLSPLLMMMWFAVGIPLNEVRSMDGDCLADTCIG